MTRGHAPTRQIAGLTFASLVTAGALLLAVDTGEGAVAGLLLLGAAVLATELRPVHVGHGGERQSFTLTEGPLVIALGLSPGRWTVIAVVAAVLLAQLHRQLPSYKVAFNASQFAVATALACLVAQQVPGDAGVLLGISAFVVVNDALVRLVLHAATGAAVGRPLAGASWAWVLHVLAITSVAQLGMHTFDREPALLPAFAAPALLILWSQEQSTRRRAGSTVRQALTDQARELYAGRRDDTAALVTRTVRQVLAARKVELLTLDGLRIHRTVDEAGEITHGNVTHDGLAHGWQARVLALPDGAMDGSWMGIALGGHEPTALLGVWREAGQEPFRQDDLVLLSTLASELTQWLADAAEPAGGTRRPAGVDLSGHTAEASGALDAVRQVRQRLERGESVVSMHATSSLADDLLAAEEKLSHFIGGLLAGSAADDADDVVVTGRWRSA